MSDNIEFACPYCEKISSVPASFAGKQGKCPGCQKVIEVPNPNEDGGGGGYEVGEGFDVEDTKSAQGGGTNKPCPYCGEPIKRVAKKCKHCGEYLDRRLRDRSRRPRERRSENRATVEPSAFEWVICFLCPGIACIVSIVYLIQGYSKKGGIMLAISLVMIVIYNVLAAIAQGA